jgi:uncharacterized protein (DUF736 family)
MKQFLIFKNDKKNDKEPDYKLRAKVGEEFIEIGGAWTREGKNGSKYISCQLSKPYKDRKGYHLEEDIDLEVEINPDNIEI